ncbi:SDR family oxidoreductase [Pseudomonas sp. PGPR40]|uniref:SDR family oxidoreductase n=1 Tax=Pseudomonas sp. PGPR40 TaxID=2913476 RepID=UPI001EDA1D0B|nr:SDR family oxidoreductase [Pseudomonas sp. PGPR40]
MSDTLLVTGASGHLGQRVIAHLLDTNKVPANKIIATTRSPESLSALAAKGVTVRKADFDNAASLSTAFAGAQRLLLISTDTLGRPGHRLAQHKNALEAAINAGVKHVVYTSMPMPKNSPLLIAPDHLGTEHALAASSLTWTILRNCWYMENLFMSLPQALADGKLYTAAGDGKIAYISRDDLGRAAAAALACHNGNKGIYTLTGSEAFSTENIARLASAAVNKPLDVIQVSVEDLIRGMVAGAGIPEAIAVEIASFDTNTKVHRVAAVTGDFRALTGIAPQKLSEWLAANNATLARA